MRFTGTLKAALIVLLLFAMSFAGGSRASAGNAGARNQNTTTIQQQPRKTSPPYTGDLSVFDYPGRGRKLQVERVMDVLAITPGKTVADIGAGSGWFTVKAARRVTSTGRVWAVDINPAAIRHINRRLRSDGLSNVHTIVSKADDPLLPANSIDAVLLLKTYHEVARPVALLRHLRTALRPGARVGIIDRNGKGDDHGINRAVVIKEAKRAGYELVEDYDFVKGDGDDYFLVFRRAPRSAATRATVSSRRKLALMVPASLPETFDSPPARRR